MMQGKLLRKGLTMLLAVVMIIGFLPGVGSLEVSAEESGTSEATITPTKPEGEGTADYPYQIGTAAELYWFAALVNDDKAENLSAHAVLTNDITVNTGVLDANGDLVATGNFIEWTPIGKDYNKRFQGTFDGQDYTISGLYFKDDSVGCVGLFGRLRDGGKVINVGVKDSYFKGDNGVGGVCGNNEDGIIANCYHIGNVNGNQFVGGVCGYNEDGIIENCYNIGNVNGTSDNVGGVCGYNSGHDNTVCIILNCYNTGNVNSVSYYAGGVCGMNNEGVIENCYNTGNVSSSCAGGVCGYNPQGTIQNCYNIGEVSGLSAGSVCGYNHQGTIQNCYHNMETKEIGYSYDGTETKVEGKTTEQFESGEVAYLLQEGQTELVWGQILTGDNRQASPVFRGKKVYKVKRYQGCENARGEKTDEYSNSPNNIYAPHKDDGSVDGSDAYDNKCDLCGNEIHSFNADGSCKDAGCAYHKGIITNVSYPTKIVYSGDVANAEPKAGDFTVNSGQALTFKWYQGDATSGTPLGAAPKEAGTYTLVVNAAGVKKGDIIYTAAELRVLVTIEKEAIKNTETEPKKEQPTTPQPSDTTTSQPPKNGDVITDEKTKAKFEVTDVSKKEVIYNAPADEKAKDITVPDTVTINGEVYKVTKIDDNAFKGNKTVTTITIGSNIQTIGKNAFSGCKKLKTIVIQSKTLTDKQISKKAFKGISKKTVIKVPKKKLAAYKKLFKKKGLSSKNKVKGY